MPYQINFNTPEILVNVESIVRVCPICNREFRSKVVNAVYDTPFCRRRAYRAKERAKEKAQHFAPTPVGVANTTQTIANPTVQLLDEMERSLVLTGEERGMSFEGTIPEWTPHDNRIGWGIGEGAKWNMVFCPPQGPPAPKVDMGTIARIFAGMAIPAVGPTAPPIPIVSDEQPQVYRPRPPSTVDENIQPI